MKYVRRKWLSPDTHSSGYIMCFYNDKCLNSDLSMFVRIADCNRSFILEMNTYSKKDLNRFFDRLHSLLNLDIHRFVFKEYIFQYKEWNNGAFLEIKQTFRAWNFLCKQKKNQSRMLPPNLLVTLHYDKETCNLKQWQRKLDIIKNETQVFYHFLTTNKII